MNPNSAKNADVIDTLAAEKRRFSKIRTGSIGFGDRSSHHTNVPSSAAAMAKPAIVVALAHPHSGASMIVNTSALIAEIESSKPTMSRAGTCSSRDSGTKAMTATTATITMGTLMKNTDPHQKCSSNQPPAIGPAATAMPLVALQTPIALARSLGSRNTLVRIASVAGKISAAPTPMRPRATISSFAEPAVPA